MTFTQMLALVFTFLFVGLFGACNQASPFPTKPTPRTAQNEILAAFALPEVDADNESGQIERGEVVSDLTAMPTAQAGVPTGQSTVVLAELDPLEVTGALRIEGSSTIYPLSQRMVERFIENGFSDQIDLAATTTADGFAQLCLAAPTIDLVNASRLMTTGEAELCQANGRTPRYFRIGYNRVVVLKHYRNFWVERVTSAMLAQILSTSAWHEVNPTWPQRPIAHNYPHLASESAVVMQAYLQGHNATLADQTTISPHFFFFEAELLQALSTQENGIGFVSYRTYFLNNHPSVVPLPVDGLDPFAVADYPLEQPLYLFVDEQRLQAKPQVAAFVAFYLNHINQEILPLGFFPIPEPQLNAERLNYQRLVKE